MASAQPFSLRGWLFDEGAATGTGFNTIRIYAIPFVTPAPPRTLLGIANYGEDRAHLAEVFGEQFRPSGFSFVVDGLAPGDYRFVAAADYGGAFVDLADLIVRIVPPAFRTTVSRLNFSIVNGGSGPAVATASQDLEIQTPPGFGWTAESDQLWIVLSRQNGSASGRLHVGIDPTRLPSSPDPVLEGSVRITAPGNPVAPLAVQVIVRFYQAGTTGQPFGFYEGTAGNQKSGAVAVTGWALDDVDVRRILVFREPVGTEPSESLVYLADGAFVEGTRPDVRALAGDVPGADRAGWSASILTNFLPGDGAYQVHAYADDAEGRRSWLGSRPLVVVNGPSTSPFGTIDRPALGETVSGTYTVAGWVLTPQPAMLSPRDVQLFVDGWLMGFSRYGQTRADVAALFPTLLNAPAAGAHFVLDTRVLANGLHRMWWVVGGVPIGSRHFIVNNP